MIAISYRREDSLPITGRLCDRLQARFGKREVFMDFDSIPPGLDFRNEISRTVERADVVVAVIGPNWMGDRGDGTRRIDDPNDFVRIEVETALARGIPVVPLLVNNTPMPAPNKLPESLQALAFRNALPLDSGIDFHSHVERLIQGIRTLASRKMSKAGRVADAGTKSVSALVFRSAAILAVGACVALATWGGIRIMRDHSAKPKPTAAAGINTAPVSSGSASLAQPSVVTSPEAKSTPDQKKIAAAEADYATGIALFAGLAGKRVDAGQAVRFVTAAAEQHLPEAEARLAFWTNDGFADLKMDPARAAELAKQSIADGLIARAETETAAAYNLALLYSRGLIPGKAPSDAVELFEKAAARGDVMAQTALGHAYKTGTGVLKDLNKAAEQYQKAADRDDAIAQNDLGVLYQAGSGVPKDLKKARELYERAAAKNYDLAIANLGYLYETGLGVPKDLSKAAALYQQAADRNNAVAQVSLGWLYEAGAGVPKDPKKAAELYALSADQGNSRAEANLGNLYERGAGVPQDFKKAVELYQKAADRDYPRGENLLGIAYQKGNGVPKDAKRSIQLLEKAAGRGYLTAKDNLGIAYLHGIGVPKDERKAVEFFREAADQDDPGGLNNLGVAYANGTAVEKDIKRAAELYTKAAELGNLTAEKNLGVLYLNGNGVAKDPKKGLELLHKAADQGSPEARAYLENLSKQKQH